MAGTFVETPSRALTIEHEPTNRALTQFKPEEARSDLGKIEVLAAYGSKLRDETKLHELAVKKIEVVVDIVEWLTQNIKAPGMQTGSKWDGIGRDGQFLPASSSKLSYAEAMTTLGYSPNSAHTVLKWRALSKAARKDVDAAIKKLVEGWKMRAGMMVPPPKARKELDHDIAVEAIFRAYTKLDPDQRIELKQRIMEFEKSYKDPFAFKAA